MVESDIKHITEMLLTPQGEDNSNDPQNPQGITFNEMKYQLISMGFKENMCDMINLFFNPQSIEDALALMTQENNIWQHDFIEDTEDRCLICNENTRHRNQSKKEEEQQDHIINIDNPNRISLQEKYEDLLRLSILSNPEEEEKGEVIYDYDGYEPNFGQNQDITEHDCGVCGDIIPIEDNTDIKNECDHYFCKDCWFQYLQEKILNGEVKNIKCMLKECPDMLPRSFVIKMINNNAVLLEKYDRFSLKKMVNSNPNMKFCPVPDCEGYAEKKGDDKYVTCTQGHKFCIICMKDWHGRKDCQKEIDKDFEKWKKGKGVKKCPNCKIETQKNEGCNHMTCQNCKYQWCWLCMGHCGPSHFEIGTCFGLQFEDKKCFQWCICIYLYKLCLFLVIWTILALFSAAIAAGVLIFLAVEDDNYDIDHPAFWVIIFTGIFISLAYMVCFQILFTSILSILLVPCLLYWPLPEKIMDLVTS